MAMMLDFNKERREAGGERIHNEKDEGNSGALNEGYCLLEIDSKERRGKYRKERPIKLTFK